MPTRTQSVVATALLSMLVACTTEVITKEVPSDPTTDTNPALPESEGSVASSVTVDKVSLYQGVEVRLVKDGAVPEKRNAPVLTNKPALVRVYAKKDVGTKVSKLTAKLHVKTADGDTVLEDGPKSIQSYSGPDLDTTFNFNLDAAQMTPDMELSVELVGADEKDTLAFPADDTTIAVDAQAASKLRVQLVPVKYTADGSNRLPDLGDDAVKRYHDALYQMYPVSEVEITQHAAVNWDVAIAPNGDGWDQLLNAVMTMRQEEDVDPDVYYIGVFDPATSLSKYCRAGCVLGIAPASGLSPELDTEMALRTALITGYQSDRSGGTIAQELAHAMGRMHAPCGNPAAIDPKYPYKDAAIGSTGWDPIAKELVSDDDHEDFMSYCGPVWVSDYTYKAIFDRMQKVTKLAGGSSKSTKMVVSTAPTAKAKRAPLTKEQIAWTVRQP